MPPRMHRIGAGTKELPVDLHVLYVVWDWPGSGDDDVNCHVNSPIWKCA